LITPVIGYSLATRLVAARGPQHQLGFSQLPSHDYSDAVMHATVWCMY